VKIRYFAWLRERLNRSEEEVTPPPDVTTVGELIQWLRSRDEAADLAMEKPQLIRAAVDATLATHDTPVTGASVVALFPPMTGG
jgi:molybdopterin synthase sulfur carrier subunit